jgi:hypothetical protein
MTEDVGTKCDEHKLPLRLRRLREQFRQGKYEVDALRLIEALARAGGIKPD